MSGSVIYELCSVGNVDALVLHLKTNSSEINVRDKEVINYDINIIILFYLMHSIFVLLTISVWCGSLL